VPWINNDILATGATYTWTATTTRTLDVTSLDIEAGDFVGLVLNFDPTPPSPFNGFTNITPSPGSFAPAGSEESTSVWWQVATGVITAFTFTFTAGGANSASIIVYRVKARGVLPYAGTYLDAQPQTESGSTADTLTPTTAKANTLFTLLIFNQNDTYLSSSNARDISVHEQEGAAFNDSIALIARDAARGGYAGATYSTTGTEYGTITWLMSLATAGPRVWTTEET
jgi:hypothetical protein